MNAALLYLAERTFVNGLRFRLSRLRNPRYLVPTLVGLGYFAWLFSAGGVGGGPAAPASPGIPTSTGGAFTVVFLLLLAMTWVFSSRTPTLHFTEAEVHLLFPAPLARRDLVRYRLLKMQPGAILSSLVLVGFLWRSRGMAAAPYAAAGAFVAWNVFFLHQMGASLTVANLLRHGRAGIRRWIPGFVAIGGIAAAVALSLRLPEGPIEGPGEVFRWLDGLLAGGVGGAILWPLRSVAQLPLAASPVEFATRLAPALGLVALLYLWVVRTDAAFEESELAHAQETALRRSAMLRGQPAAEAARSADRAAKPAPIRLAAKGPAWRAFAWKTFVAQTRQTSPVFFLVLFLLLFAGGAALVVGVRDSEGASAGEVVGMLFAVLAVVLCVVSPTLFREGLQGDLQKAELLKTLPAGGRDLLRGTVGAGALYAGILQILLVGAGLAFMIAAPSDEIPWTAAAAGAAAAAILLPAVTALSLALANGLVLMFPAWILPEKGEMAAETRGVEGMGRRIVVGSGRLLALLLLLVAPAMVGVPAAAAGIAIVGAAALPVAALLAGGVILVEIELLVRGFGRVLDHLDPGEEGLL